MGNNKIRTLISSCTQLKMIEVKRIQETDLNQGFELVYRIGFSY